MSNKLSLLVSFIGADKLSGAIRNITSTSKKGSVALKAMSDESRRLKREMKDVQKEIASGGLIGDRSIGKLVERQRDLARQIEFSNRQIEQQKQKLSQLAAIERTTADRQRMAADLKSSGQSDVVQGASLAAPVLLAVKAAADFSTGMVDIQQKADLSNRATDRLKNTIIQAAAATKQLPEDMRAAVDVLAGKGLDPRQAVLLAPAIGRLGTAFRVDLADGAAAAYANLNNLKVPISQATAAFDILGTSTNMGGFEYSAMAKHLPALTAKMASLGSTGLNALGHLGAALQVAEKATGDGDQAANNVLNLLAKINAPEVRKNFSKFGIEIAESVEAAARAGKDPIEEIVRLTNVAVSKGARLGDVFGDMQAQDAVRALTQNWAEYSRIRNASLSSSGVIDKAFNQRVLRDANVNWRAFMGTASTLALTLGTTLLPTMTEALSQITGIAAGVSAWAQANPEAAGTIMKLVAGLAVFKIGLGAAKIALGGIIGPFATAWGWFQKMRTLGVLSKGLWLLRSGAWVAGKAILFMGRALLTNPIGLLVTAIGIAAYVIWQNWSKITGYFRTNWTAIRNIMLGALVIFFPAVAATIWFAKKIYDNWGAIKATTVSVFTAIKNFLFGAAIGMAKIVAPWIAPWLVIGKFMLGLVGQFLGFGKSIIQGLINGIVSMTGSVISAVLNLAGKVGAQFADSLGIKSPSVLFMQYGGFVAQGLSHGIDRGAGLAARSAAKMASGVATAGMPRLAAAGPPIRSAAGGTPSANAFGSGGMTVNFTINALPGQDVNQLADKVIAKMEQVMGVRRRSSFEDD